MQENIKRYKYNIITEEKSINSVIKIFDKTNLPIVFVVNKRNKLIGSVTDGDIRRAILKNIDLKSSIKNIKNKKPQFLDNEELDNESLIKTIFRKKLIRFLPVLKNNKIVKIIDRANYQLTNNSECDVVIMAGGKGKRLMPLTKTTPKPLLKIGDKPMIAKIIDNFRSEGFFNFTIIVNYLGKKIINELKNHYSNQVDINFVLEKNFLGTIGGLSLIKKKLSKNFILVNADVLTNVNIKKMLDFHNLEKCFVTIGCINHYFEIPYGVINYNQNKFLKINEKPKYSELVSAGIYILNNKILKKLKKNKKCDVPELLNSIKENIKIYPIFEHWIDVGEASKLNQALNFYVKRKK